MMKKILVVDDDLDILTLVKTLLSYNDFSVATESKWENINSTIRRFVPDLILLDISLVGADGREICRNIKADRFTGHIPVILFSANAELGKDFQEYRAQEFIAKPFELSHLVQTIRSFL